MKHLSPNKRSGKCICTILLLTTLLLQLIVPVSAQSFGIIGSVLSTDIKAYINGAGIPAYNVDGNMVIVGSDLRNYGFHVVYDNDTRTSSVGYTGTNGTWSPLAVPENEADSIGEKVMDVYDTDITVTVNGVEVQSYNVDGKMAFKFSELKVYGTYQYDNDTRSTSLKLPGFDGTAPVVTKPEEKPVETTEPETKPEEKPAETTKPENDVRLIQMGGFGGEGRVSYNLFSNGYLLIFNDGGTGVMPDWNVDEGSFPNWFERRDLITKVVIKEGVVNIGNQTFIDCYNLTEVVIPDTVTEIDQYAFYGCTKLKNINIPDSVTSIGGCAFGCCSELESIVLPKNLTVVMNGMFMECTKLSNVTIPEGVTEIKRWAFYNCDSLIKVTIPSTVTALGSEVFFNCDNLSEVNSEAEFSLYENSFGECPKLKGITSSDGITEFSTIFPEAK